MNKYNFEVGLVNIAAGLMHRWFYDDAYGMCRVVEFSGHKSKETGKMEPVLYYDYVGSKGQVVPGENSSLDEVRQWVAKEPSNVD
jgi:hypothetical protein